MHVSRRRPRIKITTSLLSMFEAAEGNPSFQEHDYTYVYRIEMQQGSDLVTVP